MSHYNIIHVCVCGSDPVKAEWYEDGILRAREKMQKMQDEKASEHQQKMEEVCHALWRGCVYHSLHVCVSCFPTILINDFHIAKYDRLLLLLVLLCREQLRRGRRRSSSGRLSEQSVNPRNLHQKRWDYRKHKTVSLHFPSV